MPKPIAGETRDEFITRCMSDDESVSDFPDRNQRLAVCNSFWDESQKRATNISDYVKKFDSKHDKIVYK